MDWYTDVNERTGYPNRLHLVISANQSLNKPVFGSRPILEMVTFCDEVVAWKHFRHFWCFVREIHLRPVDMEFGFWLLAWKEIERTVELPEFLDALTLVWRHWSDRCTIYAGLYPCIQCMSIYRQRCLHHFVYAPSQWETTLQCNVVSHWLSACTEWSLQLSSRFVVSCGGLTSWSSHPYSAGLFHWCWDIRL